MPQEYTVSQVSSKEPKRWKNDYGTMVTYVVMLEGHQNPVQINKKEASNAPIVGDTIYGHIEPTDFGDKFKSDLRTSGSGGNKTSGQSASYTPRDDASIKAQFAIKAAIQYVIGDNTTPMTTQDVETYAKIFYAMVERVKDSVPPTLKASTDINDSEDEKINLDDIPF